MEVKARYVALLLTGILAISLGLTALTYAPVAPAEGLQVTAATYPLYTAVLNVVGDTAGVSVSCLIQPTVGCTHEYQLSPAEMQALAAGDVVVRGAGDEFLEAALAGLPALRQIQTVAEGELLPACREEHTHEGHHHQYNEHSWVSPTRYSRQVEAIRDGLCAVDPANEAAYTRNAAAYLEKIEAVTAGFDTVALDGAVLLHDSVAYAAEFLGLPVLATLPLGEDQGVSAADLAAAAQAVAGRRVVLLYDAQFAGQEFDLERYAAAAYTVVWDTAVLPRDGVADADAWLTAMAENQRRWEAMG